MGENYAYAESPNLLFHLVQKFLKPALTIRSPQCKHWHALLVKIPDLEIKDEPSQQSAMNFKYKS
jgi:hypothetical protein